MIRIWVAILALLVAALPARAEEPAARAKMHAFDFLLGTWEGEGWILMGPQRRNFRQREIVRPAAGGTVVVIDGLGLGTDPDNKDKIVHQAFAVAHWNAAANAYRWLAFRADGASLEATPTLSDKQLVWELPPANDRRVRFTIKREADGRWHETGESWTGDGKPVTFLDMSLRRTGDAPR
jgi:hypothetical protein